MFGRARLWLSVGGATCPASDVPHMPAAIDETVEVPRTPGPGKGDLTRQPGAARAGGKGKPARTPFTSTDWVQ